jgi:hypothetical protein
MNKIEFAKKCMEPITSERFFNCEELLCRTSCPYGMDVAVEENCTDYLRKKWAEEVLAEQTQKELEEIRECRNTTGIRLYPPSTYIATPALAEPREEEDYEEKSIAGYITKCLTCGELFTSSISLATQCRSCYDKKLDSNETMQKAVQGKEMTDTPIPQFELKTRGGYEYVIYKTYKEEEADGRYCVHGAVKNPIGDWQMVSWGLNGRENRTDLLNDYDLLPLKPKKRRFKTAEELVANRYGILDFRGNGQITVIHGGKDYTRMLSDVPEGNYSKDWLDVFTVEENI